MLRTIQQVAREIATHNVATKCPYAAPYLETLKGGRMYQVAESLEQIDEIVIRFLCNAQTWRGADARRLKQELKQIIGIK
jgi:hypothetical protein